MHKLITIPNPFDLDCRAIIQSKDSNTPSVIYFALTAKETLCLDPFNQMVQYLKGYPINFFSITLPYHDEGIPHAKTIDHWRSELLSGPDFLLDFMKKLEALSHFLEKEQLLSIKNSCLAGLSRGGYIACFLASMIKEFRFVLAFSPMSVIFSDDEKAELIKKNLFNPHWELKFFTQDLYDRDIKFFIGNRDVKVDSAKCFSFIHQLSEIAFQNRIRPCKAELHIYPSVGLKGHGTPPEIFSKGAHYLLDIFSLKK
jgi:hypothetical protein